MKSRFTFILFLTLIFSDAIAQDQKGSYDKFQDDVIEAYKELSKPPIKNYFEVLSNTVKYTFTPLNPLFLDALFGYSTAFKENEGAAVDSLFTSIFRHLKERSIWISNNEVIVKYGPMFQLYNEQLCSCITSRLTKESMMDKVLKAQQECMSVKLLDTAFLMKIKDVAGETTINDMYKLQQFLVAYFYSNCEIINYKLNETLLNGFVWEQYEGAIYSQRRSEGERIFKLFHEKKYDSLETLFPKYKNYSKQLTEAYNKLKEPGITLQSYYFRGINTKESPRTTISLTNKDGAGMEVHLYHDAHKLRANITSMDIKKLERSDLPQEDMIEEIREEKIDTTQSKK